MMTNDTIQKLAIESGIAKFIREDNVFLIKFAELIVRECATIADIAEPYKSNENILKKFGIDK